MKKPRKKQRLKELIVREIKRYLDDPDTIEAVTAINYKDGTKTVNYNDMECALSVRLLPVSDLEIVAALKSIVYSSLPLMDLVLLEMFFLRR